MTQDRPQSLHQLPKHTRALVEMLPFDHPTRVMDVGANPANVPDYAPLRNAGVVDVHGFEPGEVAYQDLIAKARPNEHYHQVAIGRTGPATFYLTENASFASLYVPSQRHVETLGHWEKSLSVMDKIPVDCMALDDLPDMPKPDFLKMDTQGSELAILEGGRDCLSDAVAVMPELRFFQLYEGEPMFGEVDACLRDMGFALLKILPGATLRLGSSRIERMKRWNMRSQMIDADFIYLRDLAHPEKLSDAQLAHMALLSDAVFEAKDVTLRCLDLLVEREALEDAQIDTYIAALPPKYKLSED